METRKLYYEDCHLRRFLGQVLSCEQTDKGWEVILDATAFYPEGGGQACDLGVLGGVRVLDVQEKGESLLLPTDRFFAEYPALTLTTEKQDKMCRCGNPLHIQGVKNGTYRIYGVNGEFLCLSRAEQGTLTSLKNFFGA